MIERRASKTKIKENEEEQKFRIKLKKAARRSGKLKNKEGKVAKSSSKKSAKVSGDRSSRT